MIRLIVSALLCSSIMALSSQDPTPPDDLFGQDLRTWLRTNWYSPWHDDLGYSPARELMFGSIDAEGGQITCVYSGYSRAAETTTFPEPMNTEHTVPQSWFDGNLPMRSDLHHIFPTHQDANSTRGSLPFGETDDNQVDDWMVGSAGNYTTTSSVPSSGIDDYSEVIFTEYFEPREVQKGNTARAIFYFYTMYPETEPGIEAIADLNTLYSWHQMDPPDALEIERDEEIQSSQGNYNPYIRMPDLVGPAWGFVTGLGDLEHGLFMLSPNPAQDVISIDSSIEVVHHEVLDITGRTHRCILRNGQLNVGGIQPGLYILRIWTPEGSAQRSFVVEN